METLFAVTSADPRLRRDVFQEGCALTRALFGNAPHAVVTSGAANGACWRRVNGSGGGFARDDESGAWLLAAGTWLHDEGWGPGDEAKLLARARTVGAERLSRELDGFFAIILGGLGARTGGLGATQVRTGGLGAPGRPQWEDRREPERATQVRTEPRADEMIVLTDPFGSCHVFVRELPGIAAVSTSSMLLAGLEPMARPDPIGCQELLATGIVYEARTLHRGIAKLAPATVTRLRHGAVQHTARTWHLADAAEDTLGGDDAVDALHDVLTTAVRRIQAHHPRLVADLTGGFDSRALVAALLCARLQFSTTVTGAPAHPDVRIAARVAAAAALPHLHLPPRSPRTVEEVREAVRFVDGAADAVEYASVLAVHERLAPSFDLSLNGSAGEIARGRWWEVLGGRVGARAPLDAEHMAKARFLPRGPLANLFPEGDRLALADHLRDLVARSVAGLSDRRNTFQANHVYLSLRMQSWQGRIASATNRLWPCLSPFLLRSVQRRIVSMTVQARKRSRLVRRFLADYRPDLAAIETTHGGPALPLRLSTAIRFGGVPRQMAAGAWKRLARGREAVPALTARFHLQLDPELGEILRADALALREIADPAGLARFLADSGVRGFPYEAQWNRLLGYELAMHEVERARAEARRSEETAAAPAAPEDRAPA